MQSWTVLCTTNRKGESLGRKWKRKAVEETPIANTGKIQNIYFDEIENTYCNTLIFDTLNTRIL